MSRIYYHKLVRDNIKDKIISKGEECEVRTITDDTEFYQELLKKVTEEANELAKVSSRTEFLSEYADLMAVLDALTSYHEISEAEIKVAITENVAKKGLYKNRHFLLWSADADYQTPKS